MQNNDIFIDSTGNRSSFVNIYWFNVSVCTFVWKKFHVRVMWCVWMCLFALFKSQIGSVWIIEEASYFGKAIVDWFLPVKKACSILYVHTYYCSIVRLSLSMCLYVFCNIPTSKLCDDFLYLLYSIFDVGKEICIIIIYVMCDMW